jgi:hypothetical protein
MIFVLLFCLSGVDSALGYEYGEAEISPQSSFLGVILNFLILLMVCSCIFHTKKIESFLKGGELSFSWFLILISFLALTFLQLVNLGNSMNIFKFDSILYSFVKLIWIILLGWGIYRLKQVLS